MISKFQLSNLVQQRVPYLLFNMIQADLNSQADERLVGGVIASSVQEITHKINERNLDKMFPIILCCIDGALSCDAAKELSEEGFINVYVVDGGYQNLIK